MDYYSLEEMDTDWRQIETDQRNPLLIPLIIHQTLQNCDKSTLKLTRLVCKTWEEESNKILTFKQFPLLLSNLKEFSTSPFWRTNHVIIDKDFDTPAEQVGLILQNLQQDYDLRIRFLEIQTAPWTLHHLTTVFQLYPHLEELTLSEDFVLPKQCNSSSCILKSQPILRNLHSIHLNLSDENLQNLANVEFLLQLYQITPNLKKITCWGSKLTDPGSTLTTIFSKLLFRSVLSSFSSGQSLAALNHLDINVDLRNEDLELLERAKLPLQFLHLPLDSRICATNVDNLLTSLSCTLTHLKITWRNCVAKSPALSSLKNLQYFAMFATGSESFGVDKRKLYRRRSSFGIGFGPRDLLSDFDFTALTKGVFKYTNIDLDLARTIFHIFNTVPATLFQPVPSIPLLSLRQLNLSSVYYVPQDVFNLKYLFPNLSSIRMSFLDDNLLRSVFENFPRLDSLCAPEGFFTDAGLSGISPEVEEILENSKNPRDFGCDKLREFPSLLRLTKLKTIELASPRVTNFGVIHGVALCSVQEMCLNFPQMNDKALLHLAKNKSWDSLVLKSGSFSEHVRDILCNETKGRKISYEPESS